MRYFPFVLLVVALAGVGCAAGEPSPSHLAITDIATDGEGEVTVTPLAATAKEAAPEEAPENMAAVALAAAAPEPAADLVVAMRADNFSFTPNAITAKPGQNVVITFANVGEHTFAIDELHLDAQIMNGGSIRFTAPATSGHYRFYCSEGSHAALGMEGILTVE